MKTWQYFFINVYKFSRTGSRTSSKAEQVFQGLKEEQWAEKTTAEKNLGRKWKCNIKCNKQKMVIVNPFWKWLRSKKSVVEFKLGKINYFFLKSKFLTFNFINILELKQGFGSLL